MKTKTILQSFLMLSFAFSVSAQQGINYKAIIHDANGAAIVITAVTVQFTILENGTTEVYKETHTPTTDVNGIIIVNIGEGTVVSGVFNDIDWGTNPHYMKTEIDKGDGLTDMGTTEFKSVPYALHAKTAGNAINTAGLDAGDLLMYDGNNFVSATFSFYYQDNDLDEYGDESTFIFSPYKPSGFAVLGGDCDDNDDAINPGVTELCDGIDNDCNGEVDEGCDPDMHFGNAYYYTIQGSGACSFQDNDGVLYTAVSPDLYNNAELCGACVNVTGPIGSVTVKIVDKSPDIDTYDLDISYEAFDLIGDSNLGTIPVSWEITPCPLTSPIKFYFTESSNEFWFGVVLLNHKNPISSVEVFINNAWQTLSRQEYNAFTGSNIGAGPFHFRITDIHSNVIEETAIPLLPGEIITGTQQF